MFTILDEEFELSELNDIINHGMSAGVSGFIYHHDIISKYKTYKQEIMDYLDGFCDDMFNQSAHAYIAEQLSYDDSHWDGDDFIEHAVWMYVECRAHDLYNAANGDY